MFLKGIVLTILIGTDVRFWYEADTGTSAINRLNNDRSDGHPDARTPSQTTALDIENASTPSPLSPPSHPHYPSVMLSPAAGFPGNSAE